MNIVGGQVAERSRGWIVSCSENYNLNKVLPLHVE